MGLNQDEETRGKDSKGNEVAGNRRGITRPPLNFRAILSDYGIELDASCPDEICRRLYAGVYLKPKQLKYYVDEKSNKNCFVLYAKEHRNPWGNSPQYWIWEEDKETSGEEIEVAKLLLVYWLEICGSIETINLSPGTLYEIVFVLKKLDNAKRCRFNFDLTIKPQHSKALNRCESLDDKPFQKWFEIQVGEFTMLPEHVGKMNYSLLQTDGQQKMGLVVKCAIIRPKK